MTPTSILLIRTCAIITFLFTFFSPLADSPTAGRLNVSPPLPMSSPAQGVGVTTIETSHDYDANQQPVADTIIYLPIVMDYFYSYSGTITDNGIPVPDQTVDLRFFDGSSWSTFDTQVTNPTGTYYFTNLPILDSGQEYYVRWLNDLDDPNYLSAYYCDTLDLDNMDTLQSSVILTSTILSM